MKKSIRVIVGLGNPGKEYADHRHNVGAWLVGRLAKQMGVAWRLEKKFESELVQITLGGQAISLQFPTTFMNHSGQAVALFTAFYKLCPEHLLVVHDDLDLPPGTVKLKQNGGHGGHNGVRDIIKHLNSSEFLRLKIGIGHPGNRDEVTPYVLSKPSQSDQQLLDTAIDNAISALPLIISEEIDKAMTFLHRNQ